jgi:hypothetical protein
MILFENKYGLVIKPVLLLASDCRLYLKPVSGWVKCYGGLPRYAVLKKRELL